MKQETLEEDADKWVFETNGHKWSNNNNEAGDNYGSFIAGFKEAEKTMYSGEDLISFAHFYFQEEFNSSMQTSNSTKDIFNKWFEQFKKK